MRNNSVHHSNLLNPFTKCHMSECPPGLAIISEKRKHLGKDLNTSEKQRFMYWLSPRNFFQGGQNLLLCKFLLLFYCFRTKFQGEAKVFKGGKLPQGGAPSPGPPVGES